MSTLTQAEREEETNVPEVEETFSLVTDVHDEGRKLSNYQKVLDLVKDAEEAGRKALSAMELLQINEVEDKPAFTAVALLESSYSYAGSATVELTEAVRLQTEKYNESKEIATEVMGDLEAKLDDTLEKVNKLRETVRKQKKELKTKNEIVAMYQAKTKALAANAVANKQEFEIFVSSLTSALGNEEEEGSGDGSVSGERRGSLLDGTNPVPDFVLDAIRMLSPEEIAELENLGGDWDENN